MLLDSDLNDTDFLQDFFAEKEDMKSVSKDGRPLSPDKIEALRQAANKIRMVNIKASAENLVRHGVLLTSELDDPDFLRAFFAKNEGMNGASKASRPLSPDTVNA